MGPRETSGRSPRLSAARLAQAAMLAAILKCMAGCAPEPVGIGIETDDPEINAGLQAAREGCAGKIGKGKDANCDPEIAEREALLDAKFGVNRQVRETWNFGRTGDDLTLEVDGHCEDTPNCREVRLPGYQPITHRPGHGHRE